MATSGSTDFTSTEKEIIYDAFYTLDVYGSEESIADADYTLARRFLNRMVKAWQNDDNHLWLKETATIFLQKDQLEYDLYSGGDHATLSYEETTLSTDYVTGNNTFVFDTAISATSGDFIGIALDDNSLYWDTIDNVISPLSVDILGTLPSNASEGKRVYTYSTNLDEPFNVYSAVREDSSEQDIILSYLSYEEYFQLSNKTSASPPTSYNYDRQLNKGVIRIWPVPSDVQYLMKITMSRKIQDFISNPNTPDLPQEWIDAIVLNLAVKLAFPFGRTGTQKYKDLQAEALQSLSGVTVFDSEQGSLYFQPNMEGSWER